MESMDTELQLSAVTEVLAGGQELVMPVPVPVVEPRRKSAIREFLETILLIGVIFVAVNTATGRFRIEGKSMYPTLDDGQYVLINRLAYNDSGVFGHPQRGDIVVFRYPRDPRRDFIKRLIGLPGDTVDIKQGRVWVNGLPLEEPYIRQFGNYSDSRKLGPSEYYVLGDNRNNSSDSHNWGVVPKEDLIGRAEFVYWPVASISRVSHYSYTYAGSSGF